MKNKQYSLGQFLIMCLFVAVLFPLVIVGISGNVLWIEGWIFSIWFDAMMLTNMIYMYIKNPGLISERLHGSKNQKKWDKILLGGLFGISVIWLIGMPIDSQVLKLSPDFPLVVKIIGFILLIPSFFFCIKATIDNPYLSTVVRIQSDREQKVITTGTYGFIRHPQYLGISILLLAGPLFLGSIIGFVSGLALVTILILRIFGEEKMLMEELPGYIEYMKKVKYRLLPHVW